MASLLDDPAILPARLSVAQYHQMIDSKVLVDGDPLELFEGLLVQKMTEGPAHAFRITLLAKFLIELIGAGEWQVRVQHPISTADSEPEPDLAIIVDADYSTRHPAPAEVAVVIEVAGSSLLRDRSTKQRIYAAAGVPRYLIVNLVDDVVEVYLEPLTGNDAGYQHHQVLHTGPIDLGPISVDASTLLA